MIKNYLKIAWRNLLKHKSFSFINILGLAIGIAACMIIFIYVHNELTYDQYNEKADRIARVTSIVHAPESDLVFATAPIPLPDALKRDYPEVEAATRLENSPQSVRLNNELTREDAFFKTDQNIFSIFSFDFVEGSPIGALQNPNSIVLTATTAKKYFGTVPALGKTMICNQQHFKVTAVIKDRPANSDIFIAALLSHDYSKDISWMDDFSAYIFVLFNKKTNLKAFEQKLIPFSEKYTRAELDKADGQNYKVRFQLQTLADVHFAQGKMADTPKGNKQSSYIFSMLAFFILIIALLNYINLSTAKSTERAKEVGIRKVSGALRFQLMRQFLFESFFLITIAWLLAAVLVFFSLPFFNRLLQTKLSISLQESIFFMVMIFLVTFLLAGLYPAFVLSSFKPVKVLKGSWRHSGTGVLLRKTVTITQFAIAAALIMGTTVIYSQLHFIEKKDIGFSKTELLNIYLPSDSALKPSIKAFHDELRQRSEIGDLTVGTAMMEDGITLGTMFVQSNGKRRELMSTIFCIDPHFLPVFQIKLAEGRNLSDSFATDRKEAFLVNEAFVKSMGWKSAIGQPMDGFYHKGKVVGVVKNFYYKSLHNLVEPLVLVYNINPLSTTTVRIKPVNLPIVKEIFKKHFSTIPINYSFFDEIIDKQYQQDRITMSLFNNFTILAIFVSCLGLYGLVALIAVQRTKEIGIRKVLGATLQQLLSLLTKDFVKLVLVAVLIALPLAGYFMNKWLQTYAYHTQLSWWMFIIPVVLILLVTFIVISKEIIKTALANPVKSLRSE